MSLMEMLKPNSVLGLFMRLLFMQVISIKMRSALIEKLKMVTNDWWMRSICLRWRREKVVLRLSLAANVPTQTMRRMKRTRIIDLNDNTWHCECGISHPHHTSSRRNDRAQISISTSHKCRSNDEIIRRVRLTRTRNKTNDDSIISPTPPWPMANQGVQTSRNANAPKEVTDLENVRSLNCHPFSIISNSFRHLRCSRIRKRIFQRWTIQSQTVENQIYCSIITHRHK